MGAPRRKNLITSRRRTDDDGDEEESSVVAAVEDDSSSEGSVPSDVDDDADAEGSETSDMGILKGSPTKQRAVLDAHAKVANGKKEEVLSPTTAFTATMTDTEVMMNGIRISGDTDTAQEIHFDDMGGQPDVDLSRENPVLEQAPDRTESLTDRRRREHEEYKKKRDADPAFVPNRGGFFMHDHRSSAPGQNGFRPSGRGRGRGRGGIGGQFTQIPHSHEGSNPADAPWAHDLHETIAQPDAAKKDISTPNPAPYLGPQTKPGYTGSQNPPPNRSFSKTVQVGNIQIRVLISGMLEPIIFSAVPFNQHTRLPHHRPPLRRDKPVRISLPNFPPRHIFPAIDRSFIFIPRALRPNQQGFGRGRGRGSFSNYGGYPSGRTSAYGGSNYSPSVAMSRRSSLAREYSRDGMVSPAGSTMSRSRSGMMDAGKPVVRLPPAGDQGQGSFQMPSYSNSPAPVVNLPPPQSYPLPQIPISREHRLSTLTMHQPRPQKTVSVADIESPASMNFNPPQQRQQQPFHQQVPLQTNGQVFSQDIGFYPHVRHSSHPSQRGTPLSQIPERVIHAQAFQPFPYPQPQAFYPQQFPPPMYYYPPPVSAIPPSVAAPAFVPGHQYPYVIPAAPPSAPPEATTQAGTVAHESNGMVYYYDSSQLAANPESPPPAYVPIAYGPPSGYMIHQPAVYYPAQ